MVFFNSRISPFTSTVILRARSPRATAVVTSAMLRTCAVRLAPMMLTESVRSFQVPATPGTTACTPSRPSVPTSRATRVTSEENERSCSTIALMASFSCKISPRTSTVILRERSPFATAMVTSAMFRTCPVRFDAIELTNLALDVDRDLPRQVAASDRRRHVRDVPHLVGEVRGHGVDVIGQVLPRAGDAGHFRLAAQLAFRADLARHARHLGGERAELIDHRVDGFFELQNLAANVDGDLLGQITRGHGNRHVRNVAHLRRQVAGHLVDVVGEVFPRAGDPWHGGLTTEFSIGTDLASDAAHLRG